MEVQNQDWAEGISPMLEYIETQRGTPIDRIGFGVGEGDERGTPENRANCIAFSERFTDMGQEKVDSMYEVCMTQQDPR